MSENTSDDGQKIAINVEGIGGDPSIAKVDSSTQLPDRRIRTRGKGIKPPYNPDRLASFLELNETHATAVRKKARYEVGFGFDRIYQYTVSTPFDIASASFSTDIATQDSDPTGIAWNDDGSRLYEVHDSSGRIYQITVSTGGWEPF
ncbi:MAG: hypothetical protein RI560_09160 [Natronomonas sp.]|nr:hypothetical protein [Natronomonas sp.]